MSKEEKKGADKAPNRQAVKLRVIAEEGTVRIEGDMAGIRALQDACSTTLERWGQDASATLVTKPDGVNGKKTILAFVVGIG